MIEQNKNYEWIDRIIYFFVMMFLATLTNSIFFNQLGYYGALILILIKYYLNRQNPFTKTGLEIFILFYLLALILSTIFSHNQPQSFNNLLKRILLIPIIYTIPAAVTDIKRVKQFFMVYIGVALLSVGIYLFFSAKHLILNLYQIQQSGPGVFQYPITSSEIMSFTIIFLFSFLINEKHNWKVKIFIGIGFLLSSLALFATYKRTGWIGTMAGIFAILLVKKKWSVLIPAFMLLLIAIIIEKDKSEIYVYNTNGSNIIKENPFPTDGKAFQLYPHNNFLLIADFDKGIIKYDGNKIISKSVLPFPVTEVTDFDSSYYIATLLGSRYVLIKDENNHFKVINEFISPGLTYSSAVFNNALFLLDKDSGLTVYKNIKTAPNISRFKNILSYERMAINQDYLVLYSPEKGLDIFKNDELFSPIYNYKEKEKVLSLILIDNTILIGTEKKLISFTIDSSKNIKLKQSESLKRIFLFAINDKKLFTANVNGEVFKINPVDLQIEQKFNVGFTPQSLSFFNDRLYVSKIKFSRFGSIFDQYNLTNLQRFGLWIAGWKIFLDHPFFGVGDIDLAELFVKYKRPFDKEIQGHLHNNYFHFLATLGAFGFIAVMILLGKVFLIDLKIYKMLKDIPFASSYSLGVIGGFVAFLFAGLTEWNFGDHEIITIIWFTLGLNIALLKIFNVQTN